MVRRGYCAAALLALLAFLGGCAYPSPARLVLEHDPDRSGVGGEHGPFGVAREAALTTVHADDALRYEVFWPAEDDLSVDEGPFPHVVLLPPSFATPSQLHWLAVWMASVGHVVVVPRADFDLVSGQYANADLALDAVRGRAVDPDDLLADALAPDAPGAIVGHGTGGTVALNRWLSRPGLYCTTAAIAALPERRVVYEAGTDRRSVFLVGAEDGIVTASAVSSAWAGMPEPSTLAVVDGMTYYDWLDQTTESQRSLEGTPTRAQSETRGDALDVVRAWLDATVGDRPDALDTLDLAGVEVQ
ncbi:MAG: hypothetical protein KDA24_03155 [Deltaproteobacteria bacterium]|nr:hypothetical protein [Deltaproteobacteria bacterium]